MIRSWEEGQGRETKVGKKKRLGLPLGARIFALCALLLLTTLGVAYLFTQWLAREARAETRGEALAGHLAVQSSYQQEHVQQLRMIARIVKTDPQLPDLIVEALAGLERGRRESLRAIGDVVVEYQNLLAFDLALVLDRNGRLLLSTADAEAAGEDYSQEPLVKLALENEEAVGVWRKDDKLYHMLGVPLVRDFDDYGFILVGFAIDNAFPLQAKRGDGMDTAFLSRLSDGYGVASSSLGPALERELVPALRQDSDAALSRVLEQAQTVEGVDLTLGDQRWKAMLTPLRDAEGQPVAAMVALAPAGSKASGLRNLGYLLIALAGLSLLAALLLSRLAAGSALAPLRRLASAASGASADLYGVAPREPAAGGMASLAESMDELFVDLREKKALESHVGRISRQLPEPARGGGARRAEAKKLALLAIELRRFANAKVGYDAEENVGRLSRDLRRAENVITQRGGRAEAVGGHRVLASFEGDGEAFRALAAGTELLQLLSQRENVFDDPEPPVVVLTFGHVVAGSTSWGAVPVSALLGLPVQQLETLIREASPGDLLLGQPIAEVLSPIFERLGVSIPGQRGLMSPQPLYPMSLDLARQVTGVSSTKMETEEPGGRHNMADLAPGVVLGNRFELTAELGAGRMGVVYKVRDREHHDFLLLKILKPEIIGDAVQLDRLRGQILQARGIQHPNLLGVHDFGEVEGLPYVAMEFVRAVSLRYLLDQGGHLPILAGLHLTRRICSGLEAAHAQKVLHLGLKPENILVEASGNAKVADLGLALPTQPNELGLASPYYQSPEQLQGDLVDARADVYALGVLAYEMFCGQPPFAGGTPIEIRNRHMTEEPAPPSSVLAEIPEELDRLLLRCLSKRRDDRYSSVAALREDLDTIRF